MALRGVRLRLVDGMRVLVNAVLVDGVERSFEPVQILLDLLLRVHNFGARGEDLELVDVGRCLLEWVGLVLAACFLYFLCSQASTPYVGAPLHQVLFISGFCFGSMDFDLVVLLLVVPVLLRNRCFWLADSSLQRHPKQIMETLLQIMRSLKRTRMLVDIWDWRVASSAA